MLTASKYRTCKNRSPADQILSSFPIAGFRLQSLADKEARCTRWLDKTLPQSKSAYPEKIAGLPVAFSLRRAEP
jgi:hypothetical protein